MFYTSTFGFKRLALIFFCFFLGFSVKIPVFPFHIWLPEAHVEAPTEGSVLLAALLLKLGGYGLLKLLLPCGQIILLYYSPLLVTIATIGVIYTSLATLRQIDIKKIIAYSSISHMNLMIVAFLAHNIYGITGFIYMMIAHGLTSSALFFLIGILYNKTKTKILSYYGGLTHLMPITSTFFFLFTASNFSFPFSSNFIGEIMLLIGISQYSFVVLLCCFLGLMICTAYSLLLFNKIFFGTISQFFNFKINDTNHSELFILGILLVFSIIIGLFPNLLLELVNMQVYLWCSIY